MIWIILLSCSVKFTPCTRYLYDDLTMMQKTLFSSMESLINLMREVELQEKAAEQAKIEAALGGSETLIRVEELKKMLEHAKEANDMVVNVIKTIASEKL